MFDKRSGATDGYYAYYGGSHFQIRLRSASVDKYAIANVGDITGARHTFLGTYDRDGLMSVYFDGTLRASTDISAWDGLDLSNAVSLRLLLGDVNFCDVAAIFRKALTSDEISDLHDLTKYPYATPDIPNTVNIVAARDDAIAPYFLESTFYTHDNRGFKPPFGARLRRDFPWPRWPVLAMLFNEGSGDTVYNLTGNSNIKGTINGGCTWEEGGLKFDGSSGEVRLGQMKGVDWENDDITFICMGKFYACDTDYHYLFKKDAAGGKYGLFVTKRPDTFNVMYAQYVAAGGYCFLDDNTPPNDYNQILIYSFKRGDAGHVFLDGAKAKDGTWTSYSTVAGTGDAFIGRSDGDSYSDALVQLLIIIPAALDSGLVKYLSAFPWSVLEW